jgi:hypothetical protein
MRNDLIPKRGANYSDRLRRSRGDVQIIPLKTHDTATSYVPGNLAADTSVSSIVINDLPQQWQNHAVQIHLDRSQRLRQHLERFLVPGAPGASWLLEARRELAQLEREADRDDWDGERSLAVASATVATADRLISALALRAPQPRIGVGRRGQVTLDWWHDKNSLTVEIHPSGRMVFAASYGDSGIRGTENEAEVMDGPPPAIEVALANVYRR